jgi:hypothetical protein
LLAGPLESTNDAYAIAKIAGIRMARAYREQYAFPAISLMRPISTALATTSISRLLMPCRR